MSRSIYKVSGIFMLFLIASLCQLYASEATKSIAKSFNINDDTKISVTNRHGNIIINRWDKKVVDLRVEIQAKGSSDSKTQKILDAINIDISDRVSSGKLSFETEIGSIGGNSSFNINYEITMPYTNTLSLNHSFGNVFMGSHKGDLDVVVKHGQFQAEDLDNAHISIAFSYARCEVETLQSGKLELAHSKMSVDDMGDVDITTEFSDLEIGDAGALSLYAKHGNIKIGHIKSYKGDIQFAGLEIEELDESIFLGARHGNGINIERISNRFKQIEIEAEFCSIDINLEHGASSTLDFELQFGNMKAHGDEINFNKVIKDNTTSSYKGFLGNKNATSSIKVNTRHGNIRLDVD